MSDTVSRKATEPSFGDSLKRFLRVEYMSFGMLLPLVGMGSVAARGPVDLRRVVLVMAASFALHLYINITNDVFDLPYDRKHPGRRKYPLVRGAITRGQASALALGALPVAFGLTAWGNAGALAYVALLLVIGAIGFYNNWGKRFVFPPFTDFLLGVGYASIALYGAAMMGFPERLTWIAYAWIVVWTLQINLLGSVRDLIFDRLAGARTTPMIAGCRPHGDALVVPRGIVAYSYLLEAALFALALSVLVLNDVGYSPATRLVLGAGLVGLEAATLLALGRLYRTATRDYKKASMMVPIPIGLTLLAIVLLFALGPLGWLVTIVGLTYFIPLRKLVKQTRPAHVEAQPSA